MPDNTLRVDTVVLDEGAGHLREAEDAMRAALAKAHDGHEHLMTTWRGGTADWGKQSWADLQTRVLGCLDELADNAAALKSAAAAYRTTDDTSASDLDKQM